MSEPGTTATGSEATASLWYQDAVIYQTHVKAYSDANGDGIGDFAGLRSKLDYIQELGVDTIWLLPFYPSPLRDDGYDIADYRNVNPDYGTLRDFKLFVREAHRRKLKVITELVINHTSDQHPWFQAARRARPGSAAREYYVWSDDDKKFAGTRIIFTDTEKSNWAWDPVAKAYYWHRFFSHQPDLNHNNPRVVRAVTQVMRFWLDLGVDGMRLDAIPYLCVREGTSNENLPETHAVLKQIRGVVDAHYRDRMLLAEANQWPEDVREYFGDGDECHMAFHFPLMPRMFMALAVEDRYPIAEILRQTPDIPGNCQWAIFLRNHDELTLEMVTDRERDYMYRMYAQETRMRVNVGIRRRLAPLLNNDVESIKLMNSMLFSMPGAPIIYYGDEIGMGDNFFLGDRNGVRTPMQWSPDRNAGFSRADPQRLYLPVIMDPIYGYEAVNVEAQSRDPSSLLSWTRRVLAVRAQHRSFGRGTLEFVRPRNRKVLAYVRSYGGETVLCVANLSRTAQAVELDLSRYRGRVPVELLGRNSFPPIGDLPYFLTLPGHGFFWLLLSDSAEPPEWHVDRMPAAELTVLVLAQDIATLLPRADPGEHAVVRRALAQLENEVLPEYVPARRWFAHKASGLRGMRLGPRALLSDGQRSTLLALLDVETDDGAHHSYFMPLAVAWETGPDGPSLAAEWTLTKVRQHAKAGLLIDAFADRACCLALVGAMQSGTRLPAAGGGEFHCRSTSALPELAARGLDPVQPIGREQSNTGVSLGEALYLKGYRSLHAGINPEIEMGRVLTERRFANIAALAGSVDFITPAGAATTVAAAFAFVRNQGDGWSYTLDHLERHAAELLVHPAPSEGVPHGLYLNQMIKLGKRVGELHAVLCMPCDDPAFEPEPIAAADLSEWSRDVGRQWQATIELLRRRCTQFPPPLADAAERLLADPDRLQARIGELGAHDIQAVKTRYHGDLHLGQTLLVADDFLIIDFEGEPARPLAERRRKHSALRDVAGMLRSFDYARAVALERASEARPEASALFAADFAAWHASACKSFLDGYREGVGAAPCLPRDENAAARLVELFQIEKALYELRYELANRPNWIRVPLEGLSSLLEPGTGRS